MRRTITSILIFLIATWTIRGQNVVNRNDTIVVIQNGDTLGMPWGTGLNASHTGSIDLNLDGIMDLLMFEPNNEANYDTGDKIYPFVNQSSTGADYKLETEYRKNFPLIEDYLILKDWNCDGKTDIFTWDLRQRISAYRNVSDTELKFVLEKRILTTDTSDLIPNPNYFHFGEILWAFFDMPSFEDIDGDGDLDILTTAPNGHYIEYNKNMSMETYGHCDSLTFKLTNTCWGRFYEDTGFVYLDTCDYTNVVSPEGGSNAGSGARRLEKSGGRHSSDALLAVDLTGNGVKDLLSGDGAETGLYSFINGGKKDSSFMTSYTTNFPQVDSFNSTIYGLPFYLDADNDGVKDIVVSVAWDRLNDKNGIWFYKNVGSPTSPNFVLQTRSFMQGEMIDVGTQSKPVFFDYNGDSLMDIVVGNMGYFAQLAPKWINSRYTSQLAVLENIGTAVEPVYDLVDTNFANLDTIPLNLNANKPDWGYHPTFGDLDGDGDQDMVIGDRRGKIHIFQNMPINGKADFTLLAPEFQNIDVGQSATPQLFDLDDDGKLDLIIGEEGGNLNYYRNNTVTNISFILEEDTLGDVNVKDDWDFVGYSAPFFFKDSLGDVKMLSGTKSGQIRLYDSIIVAGAISEKFRKVEQSYQDLWDGIFSTIHGADIDDDGQIDFILGNQSGGLALYTSSDSVYIPSVQEFTSEQKEVERDLYPNPTNSLITLDIKCNCSDEFTYSVYDVLGKTIEEVRDDSRLELDVSRYKKGLYFIRAENEKRSIILTERFIKQD